MPQEWEDDDFEAWLAGHARTFDEQVRASVDVDAALQALKRRAGDQTQSDIDTRVLVAAATGTPPEGEPRWSQLRWQQDPAARPEPMSAELTRRWSLVVEHAIRTAQVDAAAGEVDWEDFAFTNAYAALIEGLTEAQYDQLERVAAVIQSFGVRYCRAQIGRQDGNFYDADVVARRGFLAVIRQLPALTAGKAGERSLLRLVYTVYRGETGDALVNLYQRNGRRRRTGEPTAARDDLNSVLNAKMAALLNMLPILQREVVVLRVVLGLSAEEVGHALNRSPGWVRVTQHRALSKLRKLLAKNPERAWTRE